MDISILSSVEQGSPWKSDGIRKQYTYSPRQITSIP